MRDVTREGPSDRHGPPPGPGVWSRLPLLSVALLLGVVLMLVDLASGGILLRIDAELSRLWDYHGAYSMPFADLLDKIGQRTVLLPLLFFVAYRLSRRLGSIRPLVISVVGALGLNFAVGVIKLMTARESPRTGGAELFVGNHLFPSGHTANITMMLGLTVALVIRYGRPSLAAKVAMVTGVAGTFVFMIFLSIFRYTHWFTDLVAGGMVGIAVLDVCLRVDAFWPDLRSLLKRLAGPVWPSLEAMVAHVRPVILRPDAGAVPQPKRRRRPETVPATPAALGSVPPDEVAMGASDRDSGGDLSEPGVR